jgi:hypothetical protein
MEEFKCISANVNKILWLTYEEVEHIIKGLNDNQFVEIMFPLQTEVK